MIDLTYIIVIVVALLVFLWVAVLRRGRYDETAAAVAFPPDACEYLVRLPNRALLDSCLSAEDVDFAVMLRSRMLLRLLLQERRRLALAWLRETRREAARLYRLHVRLVRHAAELRPLDETKLIAAVGLFLMLHALMMGTVSLYGPFRTRRFLTSLRLLAGVLSRLGGRIADSIGPAMIPSVGASGVR